MQTLDQNLGMQTEHGQYLHATIPILLKLFISSIFNKQAIHIPYSREHYHMLLFRK